MTLKTNSEIGYNNQFLFRILDTNGDRDEKFEVVLNDDFSGLTHHHFIIHGYWYTA